MGSRLARCLPLAGIAGCLLTPVPAAAQLTDASSHPPAGYWTFTPPAKGATYTDPVFGTRIRRLSDALATPDNADGGSLEWVMNEYSTMSAFNQGRTRLILQHDSYFGLYDGAGNYLRDLPWGVHASSEPRWSRTEPAVLYFINGNQLKRHDTASGATSVVRTFSEYGRISGHGESDVCFDGDHLVLAGDGRHIFVFDLATGTKGPVLDTGGRGFDSLYMTPDDRVTVTWLASGTGRYRGIELYDRNLVFQRQLTRAGGHMDVTRDTDGSEVLVWTNSADPSPICDNGVVKVRLADGRQSCLVELDWSLGVHISCPDAAGSCVVGTYAPSDPDPGIGWPAYTNELFEVELDGSQVRYLVELAAAGPGGGVTSAPASRPGTSASGAPRRLDKPMRT